MTFIKRIFIVIIYLAIWFGLPHYLAVTHNTTGFYGLMIFTWIPATLIALYIEDD